MISVGVEAKILVMVDLGLNNRFWLGFEDKILLLALI